MTTYFVTAIGTDSGKTFVSAILARALGAGYWKPIQAGKPTDSDQIKEWLGNEIIIHPEKYLLKTPESPHAAAEKEGIKIQLSDFKLPTNNSILIIEGAGGVLVPINNDQSVIELAGKFNCEVIVVCNLYLGSINHSLLTLNYLKENGYNVKGIVFNGHSNEDSEAIIQQKTGLPILLKVQPEENITKEIIDRYANQLRKRL